ARDPRHPVGAEPSAPAGERSAGNALRRVPPRGDLGGLPPDCLLLRQPSGCRGAHHARQRRRRPPRARHAGPRARGCDVRRTMKYRPLGGTGMLVSEIVLGAATFGTLTPPENVDVIVGEALEAGINTFDTANVYGEGRSEQLLG